ncbi:MAG: hypothetical protein CL608_24470 [Anaerolineaceae bacterium]|nr:hypothetical protein [Anaerolineaceae bacterium]
MIRSRLIFITLFLAYLGLTPAGVYTCACLIPAQSAPHQIDLDEISEQASVVNTAVTTLLNFLSLTFLVAVAFMFAGRRSFRRLFAFLWLEPYRFCQPPPTPPPHFV